MVFSGDNSDFETSLFQCFNPLTGIEFYRIENGWTFSAIPPLFIRIGVDSKMEKSIRFQLLPLQLPWCRHRKRLQLCRDIEKTKNHYKKNDNFHRGRFECLK